MTEPGHLFDWLSEKEEKRNLHIPAPELEAMLIKEFGLERAEAVRVIRAYLDSFENHGVQPPDRTGLPTADSFCDRCGVFLDATKRMRPRRYRCCGCGALLCEHQATVSTDKQRWHKVYNKERANKKLIRGKRGRRVIQGPFTEYLCGPCVQAYEPGDDEEPDNGDE